MKMSKSKANEVLSIAYDSMLKYDYRFGQALWNAMAFDMETEFKDLLDSIRGTDKDIFHSRNPIVAGEMFFEHYVE